MSSKRGFANLRSAIFLVLIVGRAVASGADELNKQTNVSTTPSAAEKPSAPLEDEFDYDFSQWETDSIVGNSSSSGVILRSAVLPSQLRDRPCPFAYFVPKQLDRMAKASEYPFLESGLQIFIEYKIPCDGMITEWNFISSATAVWGLHLGVFRPSGGDTLSLVAESYINGWGTGAERNSWVVYNPPSTAPVIVKSGDVIGLFYDPDTINTGDIPIRSAAKIPPSKRIGFATIRPPPGGNARIYLLNSYDFANANYVVSRTGGVLVWRMPALYAVVKAMSSQQASTTSAWPVPSGLPWVPPSWPPAPTPSPFPSGLPWAPPPWPPAPSPAPIQPGLPWIPPPWPPAPTPAPPASYPWMFTNQPPHTAPTTYNWQFQPPAPSPPTQNMPFWLVTRPTSTPPPTFTGSTFNWWPISRSTTTTPAPYQPPYPQYPPQYYPPQPPQPPQNGPSMSFEPSTKLRCIVDFRQPAYCTAMQTVRFKWNPFDKTCVQTTTCDTVQSEPQITVTDNYCDFYCTNMRRTQQQ